MRPTYQNRKTNFRQNHKNDHQDRVSFACLQIHMHSCLNQIADNIYSHEQVKNQFKKL